MIEWHTQTDNKYCISKSTKSCMHKSAKLLNWGVNF